jgi:hypothetical protein
MHLRTRATSLVLAALLGLGVVACEGGQVDSPAGELDTGADGTDNGVQPDGTGPDSNGTLDEDDAIGG